MYKSQYKQDQWLNQNIFNQKLNGTFIDIGAYDGLDISNTYYFEKNLRWRGICIEPNPVTFKKLENNRNCILENCAVGDVEGEMDFVSIYGNGSAGSGFDDPSEKVRKTAVYETSKDGGTWEVIKVSTFRLDTILRKHNIRIVDYCSIDVEGFEINVVKSINWDDFYIKYLTIEANISIDDVIKYLEKFSYSVITRIGGDLLFKLNRIVL
jgi:FkbM family methyltransferase